MDKEDFAARVTSAQGSLYRIACSYLACEHDRLDAISEAIFKAWQKRDTLRAERYFDTWLVRILIRECIAILRRQRRTTPVEQVAPPEGASQNEDLRRALERLPQKLRSATVLHYMEGYSVEEVASMLGTTKGAVCSRLSRARESLRALLKEEIE